MEGGIWGLCLGQGCPVSRWLQLLECRSLPNRLPPLPRLEKAEASSFFPFPGLSMSPLGSSFDDSSRKLRGAERP